MVTFDQATGDGGQLWRRSHSVLLAHEDKLYAGATIASLSIPWGESKGDDDLGGYHLVWPRDMVHTATGLLASGNTDTPYRTLIYLACSQAQHGGFYQNFWIDGQPYWQGVQLDQVSFAVLLAWRLKRAGALREFDPCAMVKSAAGFLVREGPATQQERWEENSGYSPSTLAANIAALHCAALMSEESGDAATAGFLHDYADFLESHIERWTVTTQGTLASDIPRHYIRILPVNPGDPDAMEDPNRATIELKNRPPGSPYSFPAKEVVDPGFLELVRYGIRKPGDRLIEDSLAVVDRLLKVDMPRGPAWLRYNHDGYGQRDDGGPYEGWGADDPGPCSLASAGTTSWLPAATPYPTCGRWSNLPTAACFPSRCGTRSIARKITCSVADRPARPCRWSGRMPSTCAWCGPWPKAKCSTGCPRWPSGISRGAADAIWKSGNPTGIRSRSRPE